ncbi:flagellar motor switch protein FliG [Treponema pectinovorum]|uniref:flagellar motor switch protein FliG n=1 Tax=Treponema pectinovorum TaxID=164 RepID=UPI0011C9B652|nr:FliG C-terminal domain-containing protein [Treponema pectinovorum]
MKFTDFTLNAYKKSQEPLSKSSSQSEDSADAVFSSAKPSSSLLSSSSSVASSLKNQGLLKVPYPVEKNTAGFKKQVSQDSVYRRVAKFLMLIGVEEAAKILPHLSEVQTEKIIPEFAKITSIDSEEASQILEEFKNLTAKARENGGVSTAKNILEKAFGKDKANEVLEKAVPFKNGKPFEYLADAENEKIFTLLKDESAPVRALVCSHLPPKKAAFFIQNLPENEKKELVLRLAKLKEMNPFIIAKTDEAIQKKMNSLVIQKSDSIDGKNVLAHILKCMDGKTEEALLNRIAEKEPDLSADLRERLFTLDDVIFADDRFIQTMLSKMETKEIAYLIFGKKEEFRNKILKNVSMNRKNMIIDEEENRKPLSKQECEKVTALFFSKLRHAFEEGKLIINGRNDEVYV